MMKCKGMECVSCFHFELVPSEALLVLNVLCGGTFTIFLSFTFGNALQ